MNEIRFTPHVDDLVAAQRLFKVISMKWVVQFILIVFAAVPLFVWLSNGPFSWQSVGQWWIGLLALAALIIGLDWYFATPSNAEYTLRLDKSLSLTTTVRWDDRTMIFSSQDGHWEMPLEDFAAAIADRHNLLLFVQVKIFHFLPTRAFPSLAERDKLVNLLRAHGVSSRWPPK